MSQGQPKRTDSKSLGDEGQAAVLLALRRWKWTADEISSDYGEDIESTIFIAGERTEFYFRCQVKASDDSSYVRQLKSGDFSVSISTTTLRAWTRARYPVIVIIYDKPTEELYWGTTEHVEGLPLADQGTSTITCRGGRGLRASHDQFMADIIGFYERSFGIVDPALTTNVIPVFFPDFRVERITSNWTDADTPASSPLAARMSVLNPDQLPAWGDMLCTLDMTETVICIALEWDGRSLDDFINAIKEWCSRYKFSEQPGLAGFLVGPVLMSDRRRTADKRKRMILTDWTTLFRIGDLAVDEATMIWDLPDGFVLPTHRRSFAWDGVPAIHATLDLVAYVFARQPASIGDRLRAKSLERAIRYSVIPWAVTAAERDRLVASLVAVDLQFEEVVEDKVTGIIHGTIAPESKLAMPSTWMPGASILGALVPNLADLPGQPSSRGEALLAKHFAQWVVDEQQYLVDRWNIARGYPLDPTGRVIGLSRLGKQSDLVSDDPTEAQSLAHEFAGNFLSSELEENWVELRFSWPCTSKIPTSADIESKQVRVATVLDKMLPRDRASQSAGGLRNFSQWLYPGEPF